MTTSIQRRISIVIPCLNDAVLLEQCLSSIVAQTLQPEEVIVVDNGSTDNSVEVANRMGARVVHEPLQGITWASAAGYNSARGDLIVRFDADCVIPPDHVTTGKKTHLYSRTYGNMRDNGKETELLFPNLRKNG